MNNKLWMSLGTALAASRAVQMLTDISADDVLGVVGLERRRNTALENAALIGLGLVVGAGAALMLAPTDGVEARRRVADGFGKARDAGMRLMEDAKAQAPELVESAKNRLRERDDRVNLRHS